MTNFGKMVGLLTLKNETLLGRGGGGRLRVSLPWILDMVVSRVLRRRPSLVPRALFLGFEAREKRPGDEVGVGHAPVAI